MTGASTCRRQAVLAKLWEQSETHQPSNSLNQARRELKRTLSAEVYERFVIDDAVRLGLRGEVWADAIAFEQLADRDPQSAIDLSSQQRMDRSGPCAGPALSANVT